MYYSLTIADPKITQNTYDSWYLVPMNRPFIAPPDFKSETVSIPGKNGDLDLSTSLTKIPTFGNRKGSFKFIIHPDSPYTWVETYQKVLNCLHGQTKLVSLEDDPAYWYEGRLSVSKFESLEKYSTITIEHDLQPYKKSKWLTTETWDVIPFRNVYAQPYNWFRDLAVNSAEYIVIFDSLASFDGDYRQEMIGQGAVVPTFIVTSDGNGMDIAYTNEELGINYQVRLPDGRTSDPNIIFSMTYPNNFIRLRAKGYGTISIEYNIRSL